MYVAGYSPDLACIHTHLTLFMLVDLLNSVEILLCTNDLCTQAFAGMKLK